MKTLKQPAATSMPTRTKNHLSKGSPSKDQMKRDKKGPLIPPDHHAISYQECDSGQTWAQITSLNPAKLEEMIQELSDLREGLAPQVPASIPDGKRLFASPEPLWKISGEARDDGKVLIVRHPGIGWLGFIFPHDDCKRLAKKLTA